jgi:hypothetical protein
MNLTFFAFVDQVEERKTATAVAFGIGDDKTQVGLDELAQRCAVAPLDARA